MEEEKNKKRKRLEIGEVDPIFFLYTYETTKTDMNKNALTHLRVDTAVRAIAPQAFEHCKTLVQVQLPETLTKIGEAAFCSCPNLKRIQFLSPDASLIEISSSNDNMEDGLITFPEKLGQIDDFAFALCRSLRKVIVSSVSTKLGIGAFQECNNLISVQLPEGLQVIEESLFSDCESLTIVNIPSSVIKIGDQAFSCCRSLASFDLPHGLLEIGTESFQECQSIGSLHIPSTVVSIGQLAFSGCKRLKYISLPPTLEIIEEYLLEGCHMLEYIEIPTTVKKLSRMSFCQCKSLSHIRIPPSTGYIGDSAFSYCENLISIELPDRLFLRDSASFRLLYQGIYECNKLVNVVANPALRGERGCMESFLRYSNLGRVVDGYDDLLLKAKHRFDMSPMNKLCYYQSYYCLEDTMIKLSSLMDEDPLAAATQVDEFGMTPLHILSLAQTPNLDMLLAVMNGGPPDYIVRGRDSFGSTPMDYLCLNKMPSSTQVIRSLLQATFVKRVERLGLELWKSDLLQAVDEALTMDRSSRSRVIGLAHFQLAKCERKEASSLVELYLWKMKIDEVGQSTDRRICRINSGASIVIPHVLQFLDSTLDTEEYFNSVL
eukprot:scaffold965_cov93-Cylindrotheca_fusiformis.AAC.3